MYYCNFDWNSDRILIRIPMKILITGGIQIPSEFLDFRQNFYSNSNQNSDFRWNPDPIGIFSEFRQISCMNFNKMLPLASVGYFFTGLI